MLSIVNISVSYKEIIYAIKNTKKILKIHITLKILFYIHI